jgi:hypothetical protein
MRWSNLLAPVGLGVAFVLAAGPAAAAILPPGNPAANVPMNVNGGPCQQTGTATPDSSAACISGDLAQINAARAQEGIGPMYLPTDYAQLSGPEQLFVVINLERVDRGLAPMTALTSDLDALAATGAGHGMDPTLPSGGVAWAGAIWAGGYPSTLETDFAWMYDDGPGSNNLDCTSSESSGCWGHRDVILHTGHTGTLLAGADDAVGTWGPEYAMVLTDTPDVPTKAVYQWQDAVAEGADAAPGQLRALPAATRISGPDRIATANAVSEATWASLAAPGAHPAAAVIARDDAFPDALAAVPLAAATEGPLLLSDPSSLDSSTLAELTRILSPGATIYLIGGSDALSPGIELALTSAGFDPIRIAGADRFATAVAIAGALGDPSTVLEADGLGFADALSAGPAAAAERAAVLLTNGSSQSSATAAYLAAHHPKTFAIGGPASAADPSATAIAGSNRYATAADVAATFFPKPAVVGFATGVDFPDALAAGAQLAESDGPLLLVGPTGISSAAATYLTDNPPTATLVYGGPLAISATVAALL